MDAATQILSRADESRLYRPQYWRYRQGIEMVLEHYEKVHPGFHMSDYLAAEKFIDPGDSELDENFRVKHAIIAGSPGTEVIADEFKMIVPQELKHFYARIHECLLILRYPVRILSPQRLVETEKMYRDVDRECGREVPDEVGVLRFAQIPTFSSCLALRHFKTDDTWRMIDVGESSTLELQDRDDDVWDPTGFELMDDWFRRILDTDASPLVPDNPYIFDDPMAIRVG